MFPLNGIMFIPSLIVVPLVLAMAYLSRRRSEAYPRFWWTAVVIYFLLTMSFTIVVLMTPLWSQQDHSPSNPGGFERWSTMPELVVLLFVTTCVIVPAFPTLLGLAFLPPRSLQSKKQSVLIVLYVVIISAFIVQKHVRYMDDYYQTRQKLRLRGQTLPPPPPQQP